METRATAEVIGQAVISSEIAKGGGSVLYLSEVSADGGPRKVCKQQKTYNSSGFTRITSEYLSRRLQMSLPGMGFSQDIGATLTTGQYQQAYSNDLHGIKRVICEASKGHQSWPWTEMIVDEFIAYTWLIGEWDRRGYTGTAPFIPEVSLKFVTIDSGDIAVALEMDYLDGFVTLEDYIEQVFAETDMGKSEKFKLLENLFSNLEAAYSFFRDCGAAHKDIKPKNIMIDPSLGKVKIIDFGAVYLPGLKPEQISTSKTPNYTAPEFIQALIGDSNEQIYRQIAHVDYQRYDTFSAALSAMEILAGGFPHKRGGWRGKLNEPDGNFCSDTLKFLDPQNYAGEGGESCFFPKAIESVCTRLGIETDSLQANELMAILETGCSFEPSERQDSPAELFSQLGEFFARNKFS